MNLARFFSELRRRRVFRVAGVYLVAAWALLQVSTTVAPLLNLPDWAPRLALFLLIVGFPVALMLAWAYDVTPAGVQRTESQATPAPAGAGARGGRHVAYITAALILLLIGVGAYARWGGRRVTATPPGATAPASAMTSVAVLPFANMSGEKENEYFSDGITEEILDALAEIPGLRVAGRTSSFELKGRGLSPTDIARQLHVSAVLEGSVRRDGARVRVSAQLVDAATGLQLWSDEYERDLRDVLHLQEDIARAMAAALKLRLDAGGVHVRGTTSPEAHDLYLRGVYEWHKRGVAVHRAIEDFRQALALDSKYAPAYAGMALAYEVLPVYTTEMSRQEGLDRAYEAARKALALDPALPEAHVALAMVLVYRRRDFVGGDREIRRAIELSPSDATAHQWYGDVLSLLGRADEAVAEEEEAVGLDPFAPAASFDLGLCYAAAGRFLESETKLRRSLELAPEVDNSRFALAILVLPAEGKLAEARAMLPLLATSPARRAAADGYLAALAGERRAAERALASGELAAHPQDVAAIYVALGERDSAFAWLDRWAAMPALDSWTPFEPRFAKLHSDPRWPVFLHRMGVR